MKTLINITAILLLSFSKLSSASLIIDTNDNSFIDTSTRLEWMDFGINNNYSFNQVVAQLELGGEYYGWSLPTGEQVRIMWANAFLGIGANNEKINLIDNDFTVQDGENEIGSVFTETLNAMSFNLIEHAGSIDERKTGYGRYIGDNGMSRVQLKHYTDLQGINSNYDQVEYDSGRFSDFDRVLEKNSTLLVKVLTKVDVPEPPTLAVFILGGLGLVARRYNQ